MVECLYIGREIEVVNGECVNTCVKSSEKIFVNKGVSKDCIMVVECPVGDKMGIESMERSEEL